MTKNELPYLDCVFLGPFLMYVNQVRGPFISERFLLLLILVSSVTSYLCPVAIVYNTLYGSSETDTHLLMILTSFLIDICHCRLCIILSKDMP